MPSIETISLGVQQYLRDNAGKKSVQDMVKESGYKRGSIKTFASVLGISLLLDDEVKRIEERQKKTDAAIRKYCGYKKAKEIGRLIGETANYVFSRSRVIGYSFSDLAKVEVDYVSRGSVQYFNYRAYDNWLVGKNP